MDKVQKLSQRVKQRQDWHRDDKRQRELRLARQKLVDDAPEVKREHFWCEKCEKDYEALAHKRVATGFNLDTGHSYVVEPIRAWYQTECECGDTNIRRITDKFSDPYLWQSEQLKRDRIKYKDAFLSPSDPRFQMLYPEQWREYEAERERHDQTNIQT